ncbi:MAG: hypothetical protein HC927_09690 [Deltaproteobacteria bacterium]|nr:hypothetical protein [Deltaproteobacteria bacterium]
MFPPFRQCADIPHVERGPAGEWRFASIMDCDDEGTFGPYVRLRSVGSQAYNSGAMMHQGFTIDVPEAGEFEVEMHGVEDVDFERCGTEPALTKADRWMFGYASASTILTNKVQLEPGVRVDVAHDYGDRLPSRSFIREIPEDA